MTRYEAVPGNPEGVEIHNPAGPQRDYVHWSDENGSYLLDPSSASNRWFIERMIRDGLIREVIEPASPEVVLRWIKRQPHAPLGTMPPDIAAGWDAATATDDADQPETPECGHQFANGIRCGFPHDHIAGIGTSPRNPT